MRTFADRVAASHEVSRTLPNGVVVVTEAPDEYPALAERYREVLTQAERQELVLKAGPAVTILAGGPFLLSNQVARVVLVVCEDRHIEVDIEYGVPWEGIVPVPESKGWRPLAVIPLLLDEGRYTLTVTWSEGGRPPTQGAQLHDPTINTRTFMVPVGAIRSQTIRVKGADFQTLADDRCSLPHNGAVRRFHLGMAVFNRGEQDVCFNVEPIDLAPWSVQPSQGGSLRYGGGQDRVWPEKPVRIPTGWGYVFVIRGRLSWLANGQRIRLEGTLGPYGQRWWYYDGLDSGIYRLSFEYGTDPSPNTRPDLWTGHLRTKDVEFELVKE